MHLFKKHISRRAVLKGVGASIALPMLDAMNPAATAWAQTPAGATPKRFAFIGFPHGAIMDRWSPPQTGTNYEMSPILQPLEPFRKHLTIVSGLRNKPAETPEPHGYIEMTWLTCVKPWDHGVAGPDSGVSADQFAARHIGQETRLPSLELTTAMGGARIAWRTPTQSLPQEGNPRAVFQKLFGYGDTDKERADILAETGSILDRVKGQAARLQANLGVRDRVIVSDYLDSVREIERRVQMASQKDMSNLEIPDAPVGTPNDITAHFALMFDLMALAFQADITRVITFSMDREASMRTYNNLGISEGFHPLSHHGNAAAKMDKLVQIQRYHTEVFAKFIDRLSKAKEADATVLDHSTIVFGSNMSNSDRHNNDPLPAAILGHANGKIKGGQHLKYPQDSRFADLLVTLFDRNNIPVEKLGDSGGILSEI
ncbi:MAG TPA: DUF1552 domain-containing protein [Vicinamibacterales bacterium]|jgi:hypothetical protein|nr:DUF1552 domain-containing protein [Vicinamibacterales bacterium]